MSEGKIHIPPSLPKTGQVTSYTSYDDGYYEKGWWRRRLNTNNRQRFIERTIDGGDVVIDRATGLMWVKVGSAVMADWSTAINQAVVKSFAGFTDWRLPNVTELFSLINFGGWPLWPSVFTMQDSAYWTSTTDDQQPDYAFIIDFGSGEVYGGMYAMFMKEDPYCYVAFCRDNR